MSVAPEDSATATVTSGSSLTFTTGDWNIPQTVTVRALDDSDDTDHVLNFTLSASGGGFTDVTDTVSVRVEDKLTAEFQQMPASHDGSTEFTFRLKFSQEVATSYRVFRDRAFTVTNGSVTKAGRVIRGQHDLWNITVKPSGNNDITISLGPSGADCSADNAICTYDTRNLVSTLTATVNAPTGSTVDTSTLTAEFQQMPSSHDGQTPSSPSG